jgi:hypothetical protein
LITYSATAVIVCIIACATAATTTAIAVVSAHTEDNEEGNDYEPDSFVIEKFAKAVHSSFLSYCSFCKGFLPLHSYCMKAGPLLLLLIFQGRNKLYCGYGELYNPLGY